MLAYAGKKLPFVDKIINHIITEEQPRWFKFQKKQLDVLDIRGSTGVIQQVISDRALSPDLVKKGVLFFNEPRTVNNFYAFNSEKSPFKGNKKLRQAISMAFDRNQFNALFYNNTGLLPQSVVPSTLIGHKSGYTNPYSAYNLEKAKQYLAAAGYPNGEGLPPITLDVFTEGRQRADLFSKCMSKIGVKINVQVNIFSELVKKMQDRKTMMHGIAWSADYPDASTFLELLHHNEVGIMPINDATYNALYKEAAVLQNSPARTAMYEQLNTMAAGLAPAVYIMEESFLILHHNWVKNYVNSDFHFGQEQYWDIDLEKKGK